MKGGSSRTLLATVAFMLFAAPALAQQDTVGSRMAEWLRFLLSEATSRGEDTFLLYIKVLTFIIILAVIYWSTGKIFTEEKHHRIRVAIAACLSLLAVIGIPNELLRTLVVSYGIVAGALLGLLPVYAVYIISKQVGDDTAGVHWIRFFLFAIIGILLLYFGEQIRNINPGQGVAFTTTGGTMTDARAVWQSIGKWLDFGGILAILAALLQLVYALSPSFRNKITSWTPGQQPPAGGQAAQTTTPGAASGPQTAASSPGQSPATQAAANAAMQSALGQFNTLAGQLQTAIANLQTTCQTLDSNITRAFTAALNKQQQDNLKTIRSIIKKAQQNAAQANQNLISAITQAMNAQHQPLTAPQHLTQATQTLPAIAGQASTATQQAQQAVSAMPAGTVPPNTTSTLQSINGIAHAVPAQAAKIERQLEGITNIQRQGNIIFKPRIVVNAGAGRTPQSGESSPTPPLVTPNEIAWVFGVLRTELGKTDYGLTISGNKNDVLNRLAALESTVSRTPLPDSRTRKTLAETWKNRLVPALNNDQQKRFKAAITDFKKDSRFKTFFESIFGTTGLW